ncbi:antimicrobial peptides-like [Panicum virgatum]|uniref:antimicrobial peptides-like n=1 Tax=Panicum virgatum TaxID=38727 RepID=UPI0019D5F313|nr:antimicrobial peptides-like [Panicum virgatum]
MRKVTSRFTRCRKGCRWQYEQDARRQAECERECRERGENEDEDADALGGSGRGECRRRCARCYKDQPCAAATEDDGSNRCPCSCRTQCERHQDQGSRREQEGDDGDLCPCSCRTQCERHGDQGSRRRCVEACERRREQEGEDCKRCVDACKRHGDQHSRRHCVEECERREQEEGRGGCRDAGSDEDSGRGTGARGSASATTTGRRG